MDTYLRLWLVQDDDGTGELFAEFQANGFAGIGSAWFDLAELAEKAALFSQYPLPSNQPVRLEGGYWSRENKGQLEQEHLSITAYPTNGRGEIGLRISAATPLAKDERPEARHYAAVEIQTNYEDLAKFSSQLVRLAQGDVSEVMFNEAKV